MRTTWRCWNCGYFNEDIPEAVSCWNCHVSRSAGPSSMKAWVLLPDNGYESYGLPIAVWFDKEEAKQDMELIDAAVAGYRNFVLKEVEVRECSSKALTPKTPGVPK